MKGLIRKNNVYLKLDDFINRSYVVCFGVTEIKGYASTKFYIQHEGSNFGVKFIKDPKNSDLCFVKIQENPNVSVGSPIFTPIVTIDNVQYINVTKWITSYSLHLLTLSYEMFDGINYEELSSIEEIYTHLYNVKSLDRGIQISGAIKSGKPYDHTKYTINHIVNFYQLPETPMIGRVGDSRIGYFYDNFRIETETHLTGNPVVIINRKNLAKTPWIYIIDRSIPNEYHKFIKNGILSWNKYFDALGLGQPLHVITFDDPDYPEEIDVFDMKTWYVVGTLADNFNGPYSGYSMSICDNRSGEQLFGMVSLNLIKITSNPMRYIVMQGEDPSNLKFFTQYIEQYIAWVTAHEIGHQLGLRHNFMGYFTKNNMSTIMDYVDVFNDLTMLNIYNPWGTLREYDLKAIEYGYKHLDDEITGIKHPQLNVIVGQFDIPFGTDENYLEKINPLVGVNENIYDPLAFVEKIIPSYRQYRSNLLNLVKEKKITSYEYNNMFIYLYTQKYVDLIDICLKYIGGRYYDKDRTFFIPVEKENVVHATTLLLKLLIEFEYTNEEYEYFIYDFVSDDNRQLYNRVKIESIYSINTENLYSFYQSLINHIFKGVTTNQRIIRLVQNKPNQFTPIDLLHNFSYAIKSEKKTVYDINEINGIFPEIGALLDNNCHWQDLLFKITPLKYNCQYSWIEQLINVYKESKAYEIRKCAFTILTEIKHAIDHNIVPYIGTIKEKFATVQFWKNPKNKMLNHWTLLSNTIKKILAK